MYSRDIKSPDTLGPYSPGLNSHEELDLQMSLSEKETLKVATALLLSSPPGEFNEVVTDGASACVGVLKECNAILRAMLTAHTAGNATNAIRAEQ